MSSSGLDWEPVLAAWLKGRSKREYDIFNPLFKESFASIYLYVTQNLTMSMNVLQCNIILQLLNLLEGLAPVQIDDPDPEELMGLDIIKKHDPENDEEVEKEEDKDETNRRLPVEHLHRLFVFSLIWSTGALLDQPSAKKLNTYLREKYTSLDWPSSRIYPDASVFDFVVNEEGLQSLS